jgi:hypothetical protein
MRPIGGKYGGGGQQVGGVGTLRGLSNSKMAYALRSTTEFMLPKDCVLYCCDINPPSSPGPSLVKDA